MQAWIAAVKHIAYCLNQTSIPPDVMLNERLKSWIKACEEEDLILILTTGLGQEYEKLVVMLDATLHKQLTLDFVIAWLLNKELRQTSPNRIPIPAVSMDFQVLAVKDQNDRHNVVCHNCNGHGHYKVNCPSLPMTATNASVNDAGSEGDEWAF